MSYPNSPEDPYGQGQSQPGQDGTSDEYPSPGDSGSGQQPGGYPPPGEPYGGGYPPPGHQPGGYGPPPGDHTGGYQDPWQQGQPGPYPPPGGPGGYGAPSGSAATGQPDQDERTMGLLAHLGGGLGIFVFSGLGWLVPLIVYLVRRDQSPFLRHQAAQALNFQLLLTIGMVVSWILTLVLIGFLLWLAIAVTGLVFGIIGGLAANRGEWYRYPFNVSWVT